MTGLPGFFTYGSMSLARQNGLIRLPKVGIADSTLTIDRRYRLPESFGSFAAAVSHMHAHDLTSLSVNRQPNPLFVTFIAHKWPRLITLQG